MDDDKKEEYRINLVSTRLWFHRVCSIKFRLIDSQIKSENTQNSLLKSLDNFSELKIKYNPLL